MERLPVELWSVAPSNVVLAVSQAESAASFPKRAMSAWSLEKYTQGRAKWTAAQVKSETDAEDDGLEFDEGTPIVAHFRAIELDPAQDEEGASFTVAEGDFVEVDAGEIDQGGHKHSWIIQVLELFEDVQGLRWLRGHWWIKLLDTKFVWRDGKHRLLPVPYDSWDHRRLFRATEYENVSQSHVVTFSCVNRVVTVQHVRPGSQPPQESQADYWWSQDHDQRYMSVIDYYGDMAPLEATAEPREIHALDLYCGAGGLSYIDKEEGDIKIHTKWAVDNTESMAEAFKANYPSTHVEVKWVDEEEPTWVAATSLLQGNRDVLGSWVKCVNEVHSIPQPGDVDVVMGGPPCQSVSGLNRHGKVKDIMKDPRNHQMQVFYQVVDFFRPNWVLMENVQDIMTKEDGVYLKLALGHLLTAHYQTRVGILPACNYGTPQARNRVFVWAAMSGKEQLPPFPEPEFAGKPNMVHQIGKACLVTAPEGQQLQPMNLFGDMLSDLPEVKSFGVAEELEYKAEPQTPYQARQAKLAVTVLLRREPPEWQASRAMRADLARQAMLETNAKINEHHKQVIMKAASGPAGLIELGAMYLVLGQDKPGKPAKKGFAKEVWDAGMAELEKRGAPGVRAKVEEISNRALNTQCFDIGLLVAQAVREADEAEARRAEGKRGPLRDHRPLVLNQDDFLRCLNVPSEKAANFRNFPGVKENEPKNKGCKGTVCGGHTHAWREGDRCDCQGGGVAQKPKSGNHTSSRVENHLKDMKAITRLKGCESSTVWLPTRGLLAPRWVFTYKNGLSSGHNGCYGRLLCALKTGVLGTHYTCGVQRAPQVWYDEYVPTTVGRAEPHNLALIHPTQARVLTIRENARTQGFPDYHVLVGVTSGDNKKTWVRHASLKDRYQQIGNAVSPLVAAALGRGLLVAARREAPTAVEDTVQYLPSPELAEAMTISADMGLKSFTEQEAIAEPAAVGDVVGDVEEDAVNEEDMADGADDDNDDFVWTSPPYFHAAAAEPRRPPQILAIHRKLTYTYKGKSVSHSNRLLTLSEGPARLVGPQLPNPLEPPSAGPAAMKEDAYQEVLSPEYMALADVHLIVAGKTYYAHSQGFTCRKAAGATFRAT
eukprot:jgi/Astpho2/3939/fgenesh1_pg.00063_%23_13_t